MSRDPNRIPKILEYIATYWEDNPQQRLGQVIANLAPPEVRRESIKLFQLEDDWWWKE